MRAARSVCLFILLAITTVMAQPNPVPLVNQPLVPTATAPGGQSFTLTVNGTGFVAGSAVNWNGTPLTTAFVSSSQLKATVPASDIATASTAFITVSNPSPGGGISNVVSFAISAPTNLQFTSFPSGAGAANVLYPPIAADFNRDGKLDFAVITLPGAFDFQIDMFLGNGDGTFQSKGIVGYLYTIATGDFNGDGKLDLVGLYQTNFDYFYIQLGNGDGTFSTGKSVYNFSSLGVSQLVTGDFNGDGNLDVAIAFGGGIDVFLGKGDGTFQNPTISNIGTLDLEGGVGDFNGDGKLDLIGIEGTQLAWFKGNGDGTFQTPSIFYPIGPDTGRIVAADLNGDGKLDLITVQFAPTNTYTVMLGNGDGTFQAGVVNSIGGSLSEGIIGDLNADGKLDLVLSDGANTFLLLGNGDGTFQSPLALPSGSYESVAGDFNNDGKLDLVLAVNNGLAYLLQDVPQSSFSPSSVTFANGQLVGTTSPPQNDVLTNSGTVPLTISSIAIKGANSGDFSQTNNCPASLAVGANCQISITFTPTATGTRNASLAVTDNAPGSPQSIPLSGTGITPPPVPYLSPANVTFPSQYVGTSGLPQTVTLSNPGAQVTIISVIATPADFAALSTCGNTLPAGGSCSIGVFFDPTASGARSGTLTVTDNASNSPQTASLMGTGQDFSLSPGSQGTATVSPGQTASYQVMVAPGGGFNQTVTLSCSGAPQQSICSVSPTSVTLSGSGSTVMVTVSTVGRSAGFTQPSSSPPGETMFGSWLALSGTLGLAILASLAGWPRERRPRLVYGLAFLFLLSVGVTMPGCGGSSGTSGGTQVGTYNLTVTGSFTSGSTTLTHMTKLILVVQ